MNEAENAVLSGSAWRDFCLKLADVGDLILRADDPVDLLDRTEGFRHLTRLPRIGLVQNLEVADPLFPMFYRPSDEITKFGGDNTDNVYWSAVIDGRYEYRITGNRGSMRYWSIGSKAFRMHIDGTIVSTDEVAGEDIDWPEDGNFEMIVSANPQPAGTLWLPITPQSNFLLMRQTYFDRENEVPGRYRIERIGAGDDSTEPLSPAKLVGALQQVCEFVEGNVVRFGAFVAPVMAQVNRVAEVDQQHMQAAGGDPSIKYTFACFVIADDEAFVLRTTPPTCEIWNFSVYNCWLESLEPVSLNGSSARRNEDGSITIVIAARDPGKGNWIDPAGHSGGIALCRWNNPDHIPELEAGVVKLAEI